jgi:hypothetical protein
MFKVELKKYIYNPNSEDLRGFCCGGSATGFTAWRRQDGHFVWVLLSRTVDPRVRDSYELKDSWILDSGADAHVCNDLTRFNFDRKASKSDTLISGKTVYQIEAFNNVEITVQSPNGPLLIILAGVALVPGFFTSIASLNRFTSKGVHWDTQDSHLHKDGKTFCTIERVGGH